MSIEWTQRVWELQGTVSPTQRLILLALAEHADPRGVCWPSQGRLADMTGLNREAVCRNLTVLRDAGMIAAGHNGRQLTYRLTCARESQVEARPVRENHTTCARESQDPVRESHTEPLTSTVIEPLSLPGRPPFRRSPPPAADPAIIGRGEREALSQQRTETATNSQPPPVQLGLFGRPAQDLEAILARLSEDDAADVLELARSALAAHGHDTVAAWLHQTAAWPPSRWRNVRAPVPYLGATLARVASETAVRQAEEAQARALQAAQDAQRRQEDATVEEQRVRELAETEELRRAFEALSPAEREQIVVEASGRLSRMFRAVADATRPLEGSLGIRVRDVLRERRARGP